MIKKYSEKTFLDIISSLGLIGFKPWFEVSGVMENLSAINVFHGGYENPPYASLQGQAELLALAGG
jgi:hypothetical protein